MKNLIIVGTGAVAAELTSYIEDDNVKLGCEDKITIKGYIDYKDNIEKFWSKYKLEAPVICDIDDYKPSTDTEILVGISDIQFRNFVIKKLIEKKAKFSNYIHSSVIIPKTTRLGIGNIIYPFCIIGPNTSIGNFNMITAYSFISHDCKIGNGNFFSTTGLAGRVEVGNNNFFGIRSTIIPKLSIGSNNIIQAGMIVDKNISDNSTIFHRFKEKIIAIPKK